MSSGAQESGRARISAAVGGTVSVGRAELEIPPRAIDRDTVAEVQPVQTSSLPHPAAARTQGIASVYRFAVGSARLRAAVVLHLPAPTEIRPGAPVVVAWLDDAGGWRPVRAVGEAGNRIRAAVPHLSIWGVPTLGVRDRVLNFFSLRASLHCTPRSNLASLKLVQGGGMVVPPGEASGETPLIVCPTDRPDGTVDLAVANNRAYALRLHPLSLTPERRSLTDEGPLEAAIGDLYQLAGILEIAPGSTIHLTYDPRSGDPASLDYEPDAGATAYGLAADVLDHLGLGAAVHGLQASGCGARLGGAVPADRLQTFLSACLQPVLQAALSLPGGIAAMLVTAAISLAAPTLDALVDKLTTGAAGTLKIAPKVQPSAPTTGSAGATGRTAPTPHTSPRGTSPGGTVVPPQAPESRPDPNAPPASDPGQSPVPAGAIVLGGVDLERYCQSGWGLHAVLRYPNTWGWRCGSSTAPASRQQPGDQHISVADACAQQYDGAARPHYRDYGDPNSWFCWRPPPAG
jgi:hypothetical protein